MTIPEILVVIPLVISQFGEHLYVPNIIDRKFRTNKNVFFFVKGKHPILNTSCEVISKQTIFKTKASLKENQVLNKVTNQATDSTVYSPRKARFYTQQNNNSEINLISFKRVQKFRMLNISQPKCN